MVDQISMKYQRGRIKYHHHHHHLTIRRFSVMTSMRISSTLLAKACRSVSLSGGGVVVPVESAGPSQGSNQYCDVSTRHFSGITDPRVSTINAVWANNTVLTEKI